jgi:hypothetical protein
MKKLLIFLLFSIILLSCKKEEQYIPDCEKYNLSTIIIKNCIPYGSYITIYWECGNETNKTQYFSQPYNYEEYSANACKGKACLMVEANGIRYYDTTYVDLIQCEKSRLEIGYNDKGRGALNFVKNP